MKYLLVQPKTTQGLSQIKVVGEDYEFDGEGTTWALQIGSQILYVQNAMQRDLKSMYLSGTYELGALYFFDYPDLCNIITSKLGPSDLCRYEIAKAELVRTRQWDEFERRQRAGAALDGLLKFLWVLLTCALKIIGFLLIFPLIIHWMNKRHK